MALSLSEDLATLSIATPQHYTCSFLCGSTFTTSLSWRQHEVSAHRQAELWRCSLPSDYSATATNKSSSSSSPSAPVCAELFFTRHIFTQHLQTIHGITSTVAIEYDKDYAGDTGVMTGEEGQEQSYDTERDHIHEGGQRNFWCGFCVVPVRLANRGVEAWAERLDHIEEHLKNGERVEGGGWVGLDEEET